jgi:hypothetical protein
MANGHLLRTATGFLYRQYQSYDAWPTSLSTQFYFRPRYAPSGTVGAAYLFTWSGVSAGAVFAGSTPYGLSINLTGTGGYVAGTPTVNGTFTLVVFKAQNTTRDRRLYTITIGGNGPSPITITTVALPDVAYGASYTVQMAATGGTTPYTWSVASGSFPSGISMSSSGLISGSSTAAAGSYTVTLRCSDTSSQSTTKQFNFSMLEQVSNVMFSLESSDYDNAYNCIQVYDPAGYAYSANNQNQSPRSDWWPYPGKSMPLNHIYWDPIGDISPNGGRVRWYVAPAGIAIHWSPFSPFGVYKFWVERTEASSRSPVSFRYRIYVNNSLFWERQEAGSSLYSSSRRYTQLWSYNTATGIVS